MLKVSSLDNSVCEQAKSKLQSLNYQTISSHWCRATTVSFFPPQLHWILRFCYVSKEKKKIQFTSATVVDNLSICQLKAFSNLSSTLPPLLNHGCPQKKKAPLRKSLKRNSARMMHFLCNLVSPLCFILNLCKDRIKTKTKAYGKQVPLLKSNFANANAYRTLGYMLSSYSLKSHVASPGFHNCPNTSFSAALMIIFDRKQKSSTHSIWETDDTLNIL